VNLFHDESLVQQPGKSFVDRFQRGLSANSGQPSVPQQSP
jgi:hypothetical protein